MITQSQRPTGRRARIFTTFLGALALGGLSLGLSAHAQDQEKKTAPPSVEAGKKEAPAQAKPAVEEGAEVKIGDGQYRLRNVVRLGFTKPGYPNDTVKGDKVVPAALTTDGKIFGGTVYFMVLERTSDRTDRTDRVEPVSDSWGTGLADFNGRFVPGRNFEGGVSPRLDTKAKYIYLYQVVNDRGLDPHNKDVAFAGFGKIRSQDIASFGLKLLVDPRYITSWGHFQGTAFTATAPDRNLINQVRLAANGAETKIRLAVSANPSILGELPEKPYKYRSTSYSLGKLGRTFSIGEGNLGLSGSFNHKYLAENKAISTAAFAQNALKVDERLREPTFVQLMVFSAEEQLAADAAAAANGGLIGAAGAGGGLVGGDGLTFADEQGVARGIFRVDWREASFVKLNQHSVAFGFTTDLPPVDEAIAIAEPEAALRGSGIRQAIMDENVTPAAAPGVAPAVNVPTPAGGGVAAAGGGLVPGGTFGTLGGLGGGGGGGLGFPGGALGAARSPLMGGGGIGGGGGGTPSTATTTPSTATTTPGTSTATTNGQGSQQAGTIINFNASLVNQQQQQQAQQQQQQQSQSQQGNCCHGGNNVVPAPASVLLGLLGLPGLYLMWRRQRIVAVA